MADIFLSYAREDLSTARGVAEALQAAGFAVFWDRRIPAGPRFSTIIERELKLAQAVIVLWSKTSIVSDWVKDEAEEARAREILIPALIEDVRPPMGFRQLHTANLLDWSGTADHAGFEDVLSGVRLLVTGARGTQQGTGKSADPEPEPARVQEVIPAVDRRVKRRGPPRVTTKASLTPDYVSDVAVNERDVRRGVEDAEPVDVTSWNSYASMALALAFVVFIFFVMMMFLNQG